MAGIDNLTPFEPGHAKVGGRKKGTPNRKTILNYLLYEADINDLGIIKNKPAWFDKVKTKTVYETMVIAMAIEAMSGDSKAFNALNRALGIDINIDETMEVVHIFKPAKVESIEDLNKMGQELRDKAARAAEGEVVDGMDSPARATDVRTLPA